MEQINEIRNFLIVLNKKIDYVEKLSKEAFDISKRAENNSIINKKISYQEFSNNELNKELQLVRKLFSGNCLSIDEIYTEDDSFTSPY